jgi:NAD(P)H dehydrogenase (quinone)
LQEPDEPDWDIEDKRYSEAVRAEMQRMDRNDAIVLVFPVWWWSMPAMLKGWIDRVWNLGFAYGPKTLTHPHGLAIGVAAASAQAFAKRGYDQAFSTQITTGIMNYCGIVHAHSEILHNSTDGNDTCKLLLSRAREMGKAFPSNQPS